MRQKVKGEDFVRLMAGQNSSKPTVSTTTVVVMNSNANNNKNYKGVRLVEVNGNTEEGKAILQGERLVMTPGNSNNQKIKGSDIIDLPTQSKVNKQDPVESKLVEISGNDTVTKKKVKGSSKVELNIGGVSDNYVGVKSIAINQTMNSPKAKVKSVQLPGNSDM